MGKSTTKGAKGTLKLDVDTNDRLDAIVEDEVRKGWKVLEVPEAYQQLLAEEGLPRIALVRFVRMNPARRRKVAELVQGRYHRDLQDDAVLSEAQMRAIAAKRGEWSEAHDRKLELMSEESNALMAKLYAAGFASGAEQWTDTIMGNADVIRSSLETLAADKLPQFERWLEYRPANKDAYTTQYAASQALPQYSPDRDLLQLSAVSPEISDLLDEIDTLKERVNHFFELKRVRTELYELQAKRERLFDQTAESRRDVNEELARLFVTALVCDAEGNAVGPLAFDLDGLEAFPFQALQFFTSEAYLFHNGIPDEAREYLEVFGFLAVKPSNGAATPSDGSPDAVTSNSDTPPADTTPSDSSESTPDSSSTTDS